MRRTTPCYTPPLAPGPADRGKAALWRRAHNAPHDAASLLIMALPGHADGSITVDVHQAVHDARTGELVSDSRVRDRYRLVDGLSSGWTFCGEPPWIRCALSGPRRTRQPPRSRAITPDRSLLRFPRRFDDVAVGITTLDADVVGFVPLLDQLDTIARKPVAQLENSVTVGQSNAEVHPRRAGNLLDAATEAEREACGVVQHQHAVVIPSRRPRAKAEISLVEAAGALLIAYRDCEVIHNRDGMTCDGQAALASCG